MSRPCELCGHERRSHDPRDGKCHSVLGSGQTRPGEIIGPCPCGRDLEWMKGRILARAVAVLEANVIR